MSQFIQAALLALAGAWLGYVFAGRRWRQSERRVVYRDYLLTAHRMFEVYWRFQDDWDREPAVMPQHGWEELIGLIDDLKLKAQDVRLMAPHKLAGCADSVWVSADELLTELVPNPTTGDYDFVRPPSYRWFEQRRKRFGWGPDLHQLDEFVNRARADLGVQSFLWPIRRDSVSYRKAIPGWLMYDVAPRLPLIGKRAEARQMKRFQQSEARAVDIPLIDPYTGEAIPREYDDGPAEGGDGT